MSNTSLPPAGRLLGLDLGTKTIGLALSDEGQMIATPWQVLERGKFRDAAATLAPLVREYKIAGFVVGLPLALDGSHTPRSQAAQAFARNLQQAFPDVPVVFQDERMSTVAAERAMIEADTRRDRRAERIDAVAAGIILQMWLDRRKD